MCVALMNGLIKSVMEFAPNIIFLNSSFFVKTVLSCCFDVVRACFTTVS